MGFSLSWAVVETKPKEVVQSELKLQGTGAFEEIPESPYVGASLPKGGYLVVADHEDRLVTPEILEMLSSGAVVTACMVEEHVMVSTASRWQNGKMLWSITHDAGRGIQHLDSQGDLPPEFPTIRDRLQSEQAAAGGDKAGVDHLFDVPIELAYSLTGFRHDHDIEGAGEAPFEVLSSLATPEKKSWIKRLFGNK